MKRISGLVVIAAVLFAAVGAPLVTSARIVRISRIEISGMVNVNGAVAPDDTSISVIKSGIEIADCRVGEGGKFSTSIDSAEAKAGDDVIFKVGGITAGTFSLVNGGVYDLAVTGTVKGVSDTVVQDGDIIQCKGSHDPFAVYIVKIANGKRYIRHIVSLEIFNFYSHLKWENLIQVDDLKEYTLSGWVRVNTGANGNPGPHDKVWEVNGDQTRHHIDMTAEEFLLHGGSEDAIYPINQGELNLYKMGPAVKLK